MYVTPVIIALLEILGLAGFIVMSRFELSFLTRVVPLVTAFFVITWICCSFVGRLSIIKVVYISVAVSVIFVVVFQFLGFIFYPGLVKDVHFISKVNLNNACALLLVCFVGNLLLFMLSMFCNILLAKLRSVQK